MKKIIAVLLAVSGMLLSSFNTSALFVSAKSAVVINKDNGRILYELNKDDRRAIASTTKIMTAITVIENLPVETEITVSENIPLPEGTSMGLKYGDKVSTETLLYGLLLSSGNDAANVLAFAVSGSIEDFVLLMNKKAEELNLQNTHYETPSGLDGDTHYSSAYDLAKLTAYALSDPVFSKICKTETKSVTVGERELTLSNHNRLLKEYKNAIGVKTGYTLKAGRCLVSAAEKNGVTLIAVTLCDKNDWADHKSMLDFGFENSPVRTKVYKEKEYLLKTSKKNVTLSAELNEISLEYTDGDEIIIEEYIPSFIFLPIKKGECVGKVIYYLNGKAVKEEKIIANEDLQKEKISKIKKLKNIMLYIISLF